MDLRNLGRMLRSMRPFPGIRYELVYSRHVFGTCKSPSQDTLKKCNTFDLRLSAGLYKVAKPRRS